MSVLLTAAELGEMLRIPASQVKKRTLADQWPCVRFSGKTIRYRPEHVEAILAMYESVAKPAAAATGQTRASRQRAS